MVAFRRFFFGIAGVLSLIFLLEILLSDFGQASEARTSPQGLPGASWYDEVGLEKNFWDYFNYFSSEEEPLEKGLISASSSCQIAVLQKLGWSAERVAGSARVDFTPGNPCDNASVEESRSHGELSIRIPEQIGETELQASLREILGTPASVCAYRFRVGQAAVTAARKLQSNEGFYFFTGGWPLIQIPYPDHWWGGCVNSQGVYSCYFPRSSNSEAIEDFATGYIGTECALGLQAAEYSTLRELFGDQAFDTAFESKEIVIAPWSVLRNSASATWGGLSEMASDSVVDRDASRTAVLGAQAFSGFSGYIGNVKGEAYLDSPVDRGENFMTVSVSLSAGEELRKRGGFEYFNHLNEELYELGLQLPRDRIPLLLKGIGTDELSLSEAQRAIFEKMRTILANPVYSGYRVYVHPLGVLTLGAHIVRLLEVNPRTPYTFQLYPSRMGRGLYVRYVNRLLSECGR